MTIRTNLGRIAAVSLAVAVMLMAYRIAFADPGISFQCFTFGVGMGSACGCPIPDTGPHHGDVCANNRPNLWESDGMTIYLPFCADLGDPNAECHQPVLACGSKIWNCPNVYCLGQEQQSSTYCVETSKTPGCEGGLFGCAGSNSYCIEWNSEHTECLEWGDPPLDP